MQGVSGNVREQLTFFILSTLKSICIAEMCSKQFLIEFIEILKKEKSIWQIKSDKYKDRKEKQKAWEKLLAKYKEFDKYATIEMVKKKYHALRACYRRELQKIRESKKSGIGREDVYVPTLWYFDHLNFLCDQGTEVDEVTNIEESSEEDTEKEPSFKKRALDPSICLQTMVNHLQNCSQKPNKDEADIYAESWAVTYRKLKPDQKIFAKRLMDDTLMYGQLGYLSFSSSINLGVKNMIRSFQPTILHNNNFNSYSGSGDIKLANEEEKFEKEEEYKNKL